MQLVRSKFTFCSEAEGAEARLPFSLIVWEFDFFVCFVLVSLQSQRGIEFISLIMSIDLHKVVTKIMCKKCNFIHF